MHFNKTHCINLHFLQTPLTQFVGTWTAFQEVSRSRVSMKTLAKEHCSVFSKTLKTALVNVSVVFTTLTGPDGGVAAAGPDEDDAAGNSVETAGGGAAGNGDGWTGSSAPKQKEESGAVPRTPQ